MKGIKIILVVLLCLGSIYFFTFGKIMPNQTDSQFSKLFLTKNTGLIAKSMPDGIGPIAGIEGDLFNWMGADIKEIEKEFGNPTRRSKSPYGYIWYIYTNHMDQYIQFGVSEENKIVTIFATGKNLETEPVEVGQTFDFLHSNFNFSKEVSVSMGLESYRFNLTESDLKNRPLVQIGENMFLQFYFDTFTDKLSSIRVMNSEILLLHHPYEVFYRGTLPKSPLLNDGDGREIEVAREQQICDITNIIRKRHGLSSLDWDNQTAQVAFKHSKDMEQNNYFSHYTQDGRGLKERLKKEGIHYLSAGENIAAQYTDGPAAVEGWLNSEGHREALLKDEYTHLGVGVFRNYYTQNFLEKFEQEQ